jgi:hypothetical protein
MRVISPNEPSPLSSFHIEAKWMLRFFRVRTRKNIELAFMGAGNLIYYDSERHPNPQVLIERANLTHEPPQKPVQKPTKPRATKTPRKRKSLPAATAAKPETIDELYNRFFDRQ